MFEACRRLELKQQATPDLRDTSEFANGLRGRRVIYHGSDRYNELELAVPERQSLYVGDNAVWGAPQLTFEPVHADTVWWQPLIWLGATPHIENRPRSSKQRRRVASSKSVDFQSDALVPGIAGMPNRLPGAIQLFG